MSEALLVEMIKTRAVKEKAGAKKHLYKYL